MKFIVNISRLAGHTSIRQTEEYLRISGEEVAQMQCTEVLVDAKKACVQGEENKLGKVIQFRKRA